jgi:uncharacterized protein YneF (UPF0154 family)
VELLIGLLIGGVIGFFLGADKMKKQIEREIMQVLEEFKIEE